MNAPAIASKGEQARRIILERLESGRYKPGMKIPSDNALPQMLGISRSIVREVLASLTQEGYLTRIQGKGTFVADGNPGRATAAKRSEIVLLVCDILGEDRENHALGSLVRGMHNCKAMETHPLRVKTFPPSTPPESIASKILSEGRTHGMVFMGFSVGRELESIILEAGVKALAIGQPLPGVRTPCVETDHFHGAYDATRYLIGLGHRMIAFVEPENPHAGSRMERRRGYEAALQEYGIELQEELYALCADATDRAGEDCVAGLIDTGKEFSAMLVHGDYPTLGAARALRNAGRIIPKDVSMIMYSGGEWVSAALGLEMTRVLNSQFRLGEMAVELLLRPSGMSSEGHLVKASLIFGKSCRQLEG